MAEEIKPDKKNDSKMGDFRPRTFLIWIAIIGVIVALMLLQQRVEKKPKELTYLELSEKVKDNLIVPKTGFITYSPQSILRKVTGRYYETDAKGEPVINPDGKTNEIAFKTDTPPSDEITLSLLTSGKFTPVEPNNVMLNVLMSLLPFLLLAGLVYFFLIRQIKMAGKGRA